MLCVAIIIALSWTAVSSDESKDTVLYKITVATSTDDGAGTDADVWITIVGQNGTTPKAKLDKSWHNDFEKGYLLEYKLKLVDVGGMKNIIVERNDKGLFGDWKLNVIGIDKGSNLSLDKGIFECNCWVSADKPTVIANTMFSRNA